VYVCVCREFSFCVFFIILVMCSTSIWVALFLMRSSPRPASLNGRWTPSVGKFGSNPMICRIALLSIPSMVDSWQSLKTPRWVAWYFDFRSCSTTIIVCVGLSFLLENAVGSFRTSFVMCAWCSLKSRTVLMWNHSILYDF
jgi:hypothetical protein